MTLARKWYEGAIYHITVRGNRKSDIFKDVEDYKYYLETIEEALTYYSHHNYEVICYCLMTNHVHIIGKTDRMPIGYLMGRISRNYTKYFNKKYNYVGHLFQGPYHDELIIGDGQLLETSRYIHNNPVKAKLVEKPIEYRWSSYKSFVHNKQDKNVKLNKEFILKYFANKKLYSQFVEMEKVSYPR